MPVNDIWNAEPTGPYDVRDYGTRQSWEVFKRGPRGGRYFIARYRSEATARRIAATLNVNAYGEC